MEGLDRQIVHLLVGDGRMSYTDIGRATGLSTSAAQQRVRRLEQRGVITGYRAVVDPSTLGAELTAYVLLHPFDPSQLDEAPNVVRVVPQVVSCHAVTGRASYLLKVQVADHAELDSVLGRIRHSAAVATETMVVLSTPFVDRPVDASGPGEG
ncbi:Lrp/AsnC family transcriptional regulator [Propionibacteriaceae bacterium Y2011]|uniref:Lrp/AsnC family transcriptional regulator n=1 Tax=Microlunatus sp. Y2014 TaxID=3418488 RepID=UPI003B455200